MSERIRRPAYSGGLNTIKARALREMAADFTDIDMLEAAELCDEKADALEAEARA